MSLQLVDQCLARGYKPGVTLVDAGDGNNTSFVKQLELKKLTYIAAIAKNRQLTCQLPTAQRPSKHSLAEIAQMLAAERFVPVQAGDKPRTV